MDEDRIKGSAERLKGKLKKGTGEALGDEKLKNEGRADEASGTARNILGSIKDTIRNIGRG